MTFNIEYGGQVIDFDKVVEAVVKADADVVGLNEAYSRAKLVAAQAGYPYVSTRLDLISKYPILDPPGAERSLPVRPDLAGAGHRDHERALCRPSPTVPDG